MTEHAVAFAMGTHGRLGAGADCSVLAAEPGLVGMIIGMCGIRVGGEGLVRLLGGGID